MTITMITPEPYQMPEDGFDICESCNYLTEVAQQYVMDDGSRIVPLCADCAI